MGRKALIINNYLYFYRLYDDYMSLIISHTHYQTVKKHK